MNDPKIYEKIHLATKQALAEYTTIFSAEALRRASAEYFGCGWERTYFSNYTPEELSRHLFGYLCAKCDGSSDRFYFAMLDPIKGGCVITSARREDLRFVDDLIDTNYLSSKFNHGNNSNNVPGQQNGTKHNGEKKLGISSRCYFSSVKPSESPLLDDRTRTGTTAMPLVPNAPMLTEGLTMAEEHGLAIFIVQSSPYIHQIVTDCGTLSTVHKHNRNVADVGKIPINVSTDESSSRPVTTTPQAEADVALFLGTEYFQSQNKGIPQRQAVLARYGRTLIESAHNYVLSAVSSVAPAQSFTAASAETPIPTMCLQLGFRGLEGASYFSSLSTLIGQISQVRFIKKIVETFSNGTHVYTFYIDGANERDIHRAIGFVGLLPSRLTQQRSVMELYVEEKLSAIESLYATAATIFAFYFTKPRFSDEYQSLRKHLSHSHEDAALRKLNTLNDSLFREIVQENHITLTIKKHLPLFKAIFSVFEKDQVEANFASLLEQTNRVQSRTERQIFRTFIRFNAAILRTNMFKENKAAMSFRLDPKRFFKGLDYPRVPYAIFFIVGAHFRGFHVRFHDIARGGIRIIRTRGADPEIVARRYQHNRAMLFLENYNLAYTQMLKNKDIPESGSKGTILVSTRATADDKNFYLKYVDAVMDLVCDDVPGVVSRNREGQTLPRDLLFFGPDEGTAGDFPNLAAFHARRRGYKGAKSFTTGKTPAIGGIPHDTYGCTTRSIRQYALGVYRKLKLDQSKLTKFMTGGPDGDLGSNEILQGEERVVAICDGFASVHDPTGISREELVRLAKGRFNLSHFDKSKLTPQGFKVGVLERNVTLPDGTVVEDGTSFRDNFHFSQYSNADVFIPCGGRPNTVNLDNVQRMFKRALPGVTGDALLAADFSFDPNSTANKKPLIDASELRFKYIIEGANLFITHEARIALEKSGIILFKDASTNKGGVTSSSLEVLAGLALSDSEHSQHMCVQRDQAIPDFYKSYVDDMLKRLEDNARNEFECIWADSKKGLADGGLKTNITNALSLKILRFKEFVQSSNLARDNELLFKYIIEMYLPSTLREKIPLSIILKRVPMSYLEAIFSASIASGFVYATGLEGNEFNFFQHMLDLTKKAEEYYGGKNSQKNSKL